MASLRVSTELPVPIDVAFAYVSDPTNDPAWVGPVPFTEYEGGAAPGTVGAVYRFAEGFRRATTPGTVEITALDPPHGMTTVTRTPQRTYTVSYELEATGDTCVLTQVSQPSFKGFPAAVMRLFFPLIRGQIRRQFRALREVLRERS